MSPLSASSDVRSLRWVLLGAVIGSGNFFVVPDELARIGAFAFFFWHFISLLFLCAPLICAELMWGKWLRRSLHDSFKIVHPKAKDFATIILLTVGLAFPPYIFSFSNFLARSANMLSDSSLLVSSTNNIFDSVYLPYVSSLGFAGLALVLLRLDQNRFAKLIKRLLIVCFILLFVSAIVVLMQWGLGPHMALIRKGFMGIHFEDIIRVANFSFFSVSVCCSLFFSLIQWLPKTRVEEGGLIKLSFFVIAGDFLASLFCFVIVAPFIRSGLAVGHLDLYLSVIPQSLRYTSGGYLAMLSLSLGIAILGYLTVSIIYWVCAEHLELGLGHSRRKAVTRLLWWSVIALFLPVLPKIRASMYYWALDFLMPISSLIFALCVLIKMPRKSQQMMIGRGFYLDGLTRFWRFSMWYLVVPYMVFSLFRNL